MKLRRKSMHSNDIGYRAMLLGQSDNYIADHLERARSERATRRVFAAIGGLVGASAITLGIISQGPEVVALGSVMAASSISLSALARSADRSVRNLEAVEGLKKELRPSDDQD